MANIQKEMEELYENYPIAINEWTIVMEEQGLKLAGIDERKAPIMTNFIKCIKLPFFFVDQDDKRYHICKMSDNDEKIPHDIRQKLQLGFPSNWIDIISVLPICNAENNSTNRNKRMDIFDLTETVNQMGELLITVYDNFTDIDMEEVDRNKFVRLFSTFGNNVHKCLQFIKSFEDSKSNQKQKVANKNKTKLDNNKMNKDDVQELTTNNNIENKKPKKLNSEPAQHIKTRSKNPKPNDKNKSPKDTKEKQKVSRKSKIVEKPSKDMEVKKFKCMSLEEEEDFLEQTAANNQVFPGNQSLNNVTQSNMSIKKKEKLPEIMHKYNTKLSNSKITNKKSVNKINSRKSVVEANNSKKDTLSKEKNADLLTNLDPDKSLNVTYSKFGRAIVPRKIKCTYFTVETNRSKRNKSPSSVTERSSKKRKTTVPVLPKEPDNDDSTSSADATQSTLTNSTTTSLNKTGRRKLFNARIWSDSMCSVFSDRNSI